MGTCWTCGVRLFGAIAVVALASAGVACGGASGGASSPDADGGGKPSPDAGNLTGDAGNLLGNSPSLQSITVDPPTATLESLNGAVAKQAFTVSGHFNNGSTMTLTSGISWSASAPAVGAVDATGLFTASGALGGLVSVQATYQGQQASATLTVVLHLEQNGAKAAGNIQAQLGSASAVDPAVVWAYPYDGTVWPRGLSAPILQWNGGAATDTYYVHIKSATFELDDFTAATGAPASQVALDNTTWGQFVDSTSGAAQLTVARWSGTAATLIATHTWTIAPASLRGTVYYWANNLGRIMRLTPGATAPDDFSVGVVPAPTSQCTMACHTVAANGSSMIEAGGTFGGTYNLQTNTMGYSVGSGENSGPIRQWGLSALSPTGDYVVVNALMDALTGLTPDGMYKASNGVAVTGNGGLSTEKTFMPAFSPDGTGFAFVTGTNPGTAYWLATGAAGAAAPTDPTWGLLKAYDFNAAGSPMFTNERTLITPGTDPSKNVIAWPTMSPDGRWVFYTRLGWVDPGTQHNLSSYPPVVSDMYMADTKNPGTEVRLGSLDGDGYPFAAGARDLHLNYEPSAAPVASGGYFWAVFHSRRTYGNILTGDRTTEKQLWIAAIDQNPQPGKDPSHPAFWLPGQATTTLNLRGYFALDPCKGDGQGCATGTDCCGGYCSGSGGDSGGPVCASQSQGCSQNGDKCNVSTDCCGAAQGTTCINHVCSEAPPQ